LLFAIIYILFKIYRYYFIDCGRTFIKTEELIENGKKALVGTAPWNVGIYRLNRKNSKHEMICGGSVIAPNLVISGKIVAQYILKKTEIKINVIFSGSLFLE